MTADSETPLAHPPQTADEEIVKEDQHIVLSQPLSSLTLETYKDQYIQIISEAASSLFEQFKDTILRVVGTVPKQKTKFKFWYGNYGGPFTWTDKGDPLDDLDLACLLHDKLLPLNALRQLTKLMRQFYGDEMSKQAQAYTRKIEGKAFGIIEPTYMKLFGKM
ncbi:hypothetical protein C9374_002852 [Naegleria lovaniensis]|uniref:Uncharacterized protein n=1 Tax=Naegleria lovaniensis TaxID=51637 RepID=A0AA88GV49_NAELO|nr:uncharacterized protein C9374_002852 [Naegleria lovaniensis]KAG2386406.1 hypothetical protein C9374_002852 [Naegleria lovaniensis]